MDVKRDSSKETEGREYGYAGRRCKRKREGQDGNGEEKGEENWMFKKSKKVMRSPVNKG